MQKTKNDIILAIVLLLTAVAGLLLCKAFQSEGDFAVVLIDGKESTRFSLSNDTEYVITTDHGTNTLIIKDGMADITLADCPDGICTDHAPISKSGETIVCLPHGVVIKIESSLADEIDMVA